MDDHFPILLAEDNAVSRLVLENTLKNAGYEVVSVENGKRALEVMNERFFPMILTDWLMPEMDGLELCKAIRQNSNESPGYVFIILLTVKESQEDILTGLEAGADDYLVKPANSSELIARLKAGERILKLEKSLKAANEEIKIEMEKRKRAQIEKDDLIIELKNALAEVKTLSGLLPICSHCKNVRNDEGYWDRIEGYIQKHSDAEFSHGICPECMKKHYPEYLDD